MRTRSLMLQVALVALVVTAGAACVGSDEWVSTPGLAGVWWFQEAANPLYWIAGVVEVGSDGTYVGEGYDPTGGPIPVSGRLVAQADGKVYRPDNRSFVGAVRPAMDIVIGTQGAASDIAWTGMVRLDSSAYTQADLAGTWDMHSIRLEPGAHRWFHARLTIGAAGNATGWMTDSLGGVEILSGTFALSAFGIVTTSINPEWIGALCSDRNVIFGTRDDSGLSRIDILVRLVPPDDISRLRGRYLYHGLHADPEPNWSRGHVTAGSHGNHVAQFWDSNGSSDSGTGTMEFNPDGSLVNLGDADWAAVADPSRTLTAGHDGLGLPISLWAVLKQSRAAFRILSFTRYPDPFSGQVFCLRWTSTEIESYDILTTLDPPGAAEIWDVLAGFVPGAADFTELFFGGMPDYPRARYRVVVREP